MGSEWEMYTDEAEAALTELFEAWKADVRDTPLLPQGAVEGLDRRVNDFAKVHGEVYDTEPRYHLRKRAAAFFREIGYAGDYVDENSRTVGW